MSLGAEGKEVEVVLTVLSLLSEAGQLVGRILYEMKKINEKNVDGDF